MEKAKVYFTDFRTTNGRNLLEKLELLMRRAGMEQIDFENKFVAIKMHFGEPGNLAFLRPNYAKVRAQDRDGNWFEMEGEELIARCICHECDHLDGHIYTEIAYRKLTDEEIESLQSGREEA